MIALLRSSGKRKSTMLGSSNTIRSRQKNERLCGKMPRRKKMRKRSEKKRKGNYWERFHVELKRTWRFCALYRRKTMETLKMTSIWCGLRRKFKTFLGLRLYKLKENWIKLMKKSSLLRTFSHTFLVTPLSLISWRLLRKNCVVSSTN